MGLSYYATKFASQLSTGSVIPMGITTGYFKSKNLMNQSSCKCSLFYKETKFDLQETLGYAYLSYECKR